jgi:hypothetical protein
VLREVTKPLKAVDLLGKQTILTPGSMLESPQIRLNTVFEVQAGAEPYMMEYAFGGQTYRSVLAEFQPRMKVIDPALARI